MGQDEHYRKSLLPTREKILDPPLSMTFMTLGGSQSQSKDNGWNRGNFKLISVALPPYTSNVYVLAKAHKLFLH